MKLFRKLARYFLAVVLLAGGLSAFEAQPQKASAADDFVPWLADEIVEIEQPTLTSTPNSITATQRIKVLEPLRYGGYSYPKLAKGLDPWVEGTHPIWDMNEYVAGSVYTYAVTFSGLANNTKYYINGLNCYDYHFLNPGCLTQGMYDIFTKPVYLSPLKVSALALKPSTSVRGLKLDWPAVEPGLGYFGNDLYFKYRFSYAPFGSATWVELANDFCAARQFSYLTCETARQINLPNLDYSKDYAFRLKSLDGTSVQFVYSPIKFEFFGDGLSQVRVAVGSDLPRAFTSDITCSWIVDEKAFGKAFKCKAGVVQVLSRDVLPKLGGHAVQLRAVVAGLGARTSEYRVFDFQKVQVALSLRNASASELTYGSNVKLNWRYYAEGKPCKGTLNLAVLSISQPRAIKQVKVPFKTCSGQVKVKLTETSRFVLTSPATSHLSRATSESVDVVNVPKKTVLTVKSPKRMTDEYTITVTDSSKANRVCTLTEDWADFSLLPLGETRKRFTLVNGVAKLKRTEKYQGRLFAFVTCGETNEFAKALTTFVIVGL